MSTLLLTGVVVDVSNERGLDGLRVDIHLGSSLVATTTTGARGDFAEQIKSPRRPPTSSLISELTFSAYRGEESVEIAEQRVRSARGGRLFVRLAVDLEAGPSEPPAHRLQIGSYAELLEHEKEILRRIDVLPNGGNLFLIHPFMLLEDIGVELSEKAIAQILAAEPRIAGLSAVPYRALWASRSPQSYRIRLRGLFERRSA